MAGSEAKTASTHYFPLARSERYPRLKVDFTKCKVRAAAVGACSVGAGGGA
jgi:hypothetical protein